MGKLIPIRGKKRSEFGSDAEYLDALLDYVDELEHSRGVVAHPGDTVILQPTMRGIPMGQIEAWQRYMDNIPASVTFIVLPSATLKVAGTDD